MKHFCCSVLTLLALISLAIAPRIAHAAESYDNCTGFITSVPTVINSPGTWCFNQNLSTALTSGSAIDIHSDNVTIDCNEFKLDGLAAGLGTSTNGIVALDRLNSTVRHCNIRGFNIGIYFAGFGGSGHTIEDNRFDGNAYTGIYVEGDRSVVRGNRVFDTGGSTLPFSSDASGIATRSSVDIMDNMVFGVVASNNGNAYGIQTTYDGDGSTSGNRVNGLVKNGTGHAIGIGNNNSIRITLRNNDLIGDADPGSVGMSCNVVEGRARDNSIKGFGTALSVCSNDGGNVIKP
jgi:hypothetical protein